MYTVKKNRKTIIIFFPFILEDSKQLILYGDLNSFSDVVNIFFTVKVTEASKPTNSQCICENFTSEQEKHKNWIFIAVKNNTLKIKTLKLNGINQNYKEFLILWINYSYKLFSTCEFSTSKTSKAFSKESYFSHLLNKVDENINYEKEKKNNYSTQIFNLLLNFVFLIVYKLTLGNKKILFLSKYLSIVLHLNNYFDALLWALKSIKRKQKIDVKVTNFLLSSVLDTILGIIFLNWLNSKISLDSSATIFLNSAESIVDSIKNLINWLSGDPAGLKLNCAFNQILANFFIFHIEIWWNFLGYIKFIVKIIFQIFLILGLMGITFQASIAIDLLALVSFHIFFIHAYAAKLYSIQTSTLISLWRLFLGKKKNPLRGKVDSCDYTPEQLFVGTLVFTILLFLLPTTLLYYVVFTSIKLLICIIQAILMIIQSCNLVLPVYTTFLWVIRSSKIFTEIEIMPICDFYSKSILLLDVKPIVSTWGETINYFMPDCSIKLPKFNLGFFCKCLMSGKPLPSLLKF